MACYHSPSWTLAEIRRKVLAVNTIEAQTFPRSRKTIRAVTVVNLVLFVLFVIPVTHRSVDRAFLALRSAGAEEAIGHLLQAWLVGSTIIATTLFGRMVWKKATVASAEMPVPPLTFEGVLLAAWWLVALGSCAYAFALGMGG